MVKKYILMQTLCRSCHFTKMTKYFGYENIIGESTKSTPLNDILGFSGY
jgi:hypothetical protein